MIVDKSLPCVKGAFFMFIYNLSTFLTSTAFVSTNAKYGIPLSRYTVFLQNCPLEYSSKDDRIFLFYLKLTFILPIPASIEIFVSPSP